VMPVPMAECRTQIHGLGWVEPREQVDQVGEDRECLLGQLDMEV
jgi:hypothetical protein